MKLSSIVLLVITIVVCSNLISIEPPTFEESSYYPFISSDNGEGYFVFRFSSKVNSGWKVKYFSADKSLSSKVFHRDKDVGYMLFVPKNGDEIGCMKMKEKPIVDEPCKDGVFQKTMQIELITGSKYFANVWHNCDFNGYLNGVFQTNGTYTFYTDVYDTNRILKICFGNVEIDHCQKYVEFAAYKEVLSEKSISKEFSIPHVCEKS